MTKKEPNTAVTKPGGPVINQNNPTSKTRAKQIYGSNTKQVRAAVKKTKP